METPVDYDNDYRRHINNENLMEAEFILLDRDNHRLEYDKDCPSTNPGASDIADLEASSGRMHEPDMEIEPNMDIELDVDVEPDMDAETPSDNEKIARLRMMSPSSILMQHPSWLR